MDYADVADQEAGGEDDHGDVEDEMNNEAACNRERQPSENQAHEDHGRDHGEHVGFLFYIRAMHRIVGEPTLAAAMRRTRCKNDLYSGRSADRRQEERVPFRIHARAVVLVLFLSVIVGGVGVSAMPHGPASNSAACEAVGAVPANIPDLGANCASSSASVFDAFSQVVDDIEAIHATVAAKAHSAVNEWNDLNDFINRVTLATPTN